MRRDDDRNGAYQHTQLQGDDRDRDQMQGGQMLRGGDVRSPDLSRLTVQEKTNLRETVLRSGPRATNINFRIGVGWRSREACGWSPCRSPSWLFIRNGRAISISIMGMK